LNLNEESIKYDVPENVTATNVKMNRTLKAGVWNTFCSPVAISSDNFSEIRELTGVDTDGTHYTMTFGNTVGDIVAGKPYMVKVSSAKSELTASNVAVVTEALSVTNNGLTFTGNFAKDLAPRESFIISNDNFYLVDSDVTLKAFRGYITTGTAGVKALNYVFENDADGINSLTPAPSPVGEGSIYNLAGQRISKMQRGMNIVNGKKVLK
jgi:hypothetical protein